MDSILCEDNPDQEILILRKKLLRYTRPLSDTDRIKYAWEGSLLHPAEGQVSGKTIPQRAEKKGGCKTEGPGQADQRMNFLNLIVRFVWFLTINLKIKF